MIATALGARRRILGGLASLVSGLLALPWLARLGRALPLDDVRRVGRGKSWWGMAIDLDLCTACGACAVACKTENNVPPAAPGEDHAGTGIYWMDLVAREPVQPGEPPREILPMPCMQCENPPCVKVCPVNATYQNVEGIIGMLWDRCIGCRYCEVSCPYSRRFFNWTEPEWPESYRNFLNPDVATRPEGVVEVCTFCMHRLRAKRLDARLEGRELVDAEVQRLPACAQSCPAGAIVFGDLADSQSLITRLSKSSRVFRLLEHLGTRPKVFYLARERRDQ
jgi:Fe-S-cluster-containing dehydrogenase component